MAWQLAGSLRGNEGPAGPAGTTVVFVPLVVAAATLTNAPAGGVEIANQLSRVQVDLRTATNVVGQALFSVVPVGTLRFEYSINAGGAWSTLVDMGNTGWAANTLKIASPVAVPAAAKIATALLRVVVTGNGTADPVLQRAHILVQP